MALYSAIQKFITKNGAPVIGASCLVLVDGSATQPTLYATRTGGALSNPFPTDSQGNAICYVAPGRYKMIVTKDADQVTFEGIEVGPVSLTGNFAAGGVVSDPDQWFTDQYNNQWAWTGSLNKTVAPGENPNAVAGWAIMLEGDKEPSKPQALTFAAGGVVKRPFNSIEDADGNGWRWVGALPKTVAAGTDPASDGNYVLQAVSAGPVSESLASTDRSDIRLYSGNLVEKIQAALNAVGTATIPYGAWEHDGGTVGLGDNQHIIFKGNIFNKTFADEADFIQVVGKKNWSITGPAVYFGTRTIGTAAAEENFIKVDGGRAYQISGHIAYNCRGRGFYFRDGATGGGVRGERGQVSNIAAYECDFGIETAASAAAEYICFNNVNTCNNRVGIKDGAGNTIFNGGNCSDNDEINFWLVGNYLNNAHGIVNAMNINHGGIYNLQCDNVTNGHTFNGCHFYGNALNSGTGAIFFNNSKGIVISGGDIDCWIYNFDGAGSGKNYIKGVYMPGGYGDVVTQDASNLRPKDLIILDCQGPGAYQAGIAISDPSECYVAAQRNAASTQALTSATLTDLVFNTVQANGDRRRAYNAATGVFTVPVGQDGQYKITATLVFQGTALNATASFAELILPSTGKRLITLSDNGGVLLTGSVTTDVYLSAGQTVNMKAAITGTSPVFGSAGYVCTLSITRKS